MFVVTQPVRPVTTKGRGEGNKGRNFFFTNGHQQVLIGKRGGRNITRLLKLKLFYFIIKEDIFFSKLVNESVLSSRLVKYSMRQLNQDLKSKYLLFLKDRLEKG